MRNLIQLIERLQSDKWMNGFCVDFALALYVSLSPELREQAQFVCLGADINGYDHVGLKLKDRYCDARGSLTAEEFVDDGYGSYSVDDIKPVDIEMLEQLLELDTPFPYDGEPLIDDAKQAVKAVFPSILSEKYMGTRSVECDYGGIETVEIFSNPSRNEISKLMRESEYASVRCSLYPDKDDLLIVWVGDRVQHHDLHAAIFPDEPFEYYIRMYYDNTGLSRNYVGEDGIDEEEEAIVKRSTSCRRAFGGNIQFEY